MDVGTAVFKAIADFSGVRSEASKTTDALGKVGKESKKGFGSKLVSGFSKTLGLAAKGGGLLAGVLGGAAMYKGYDRLTTIQDSTKRLEVQLGSATDASKLMGKVLEVVSGTPFNLDQFADGAAVMVGMGIDAQKVPPYLTAIGEASAGMGSRAGETAERLTRTFGQVQSSGRLGMTAVNDFGAVGVNALQILANNFGVTTEEMRKMISKGAVPAEKGLDILAKGIMEGSTGINGSTVAMAGTMEGLRTTLTGAVGGWGSAIARFGANVIEPFAGALTTGFTGAADAVDWAGKKINAGLKAMMDSNAAKAFLSFLQDVPSLITTVSDNIDAFVSSADFNRISTAVLATLSEILSRIWEIGKRLWPVVRDLGTAFFDVVKNLAPGVWTALKLAFDGVLTVVEFLLPVFEKLADFIKDHTIILSALTAGFVAYKAAVGIATVFALAHAAAEKLLAAGGTIDRIKKAVTMFTRLRKVYGLATAAQYALNAAQLLNPMAIIIGIVVALVAGIVLLYQKNETARKIIDGAWQGIVSVFKWAWDKVIKPVFDAIVDFLTKMLPDGFNSLKRVAGEAWDNITGAISGAWDKISGFFSGMAAGAKEGVGNAFSGLKETSGTAWSAISNGVKVATDAIANAFKAVVSWIWDKIGPAVMWLWHNIYEPAFIAIAAIVKIAWAILETIFLAIVWLVTKKLGPAMVWLYENAIKPAWQAIKDFISKSWNAIKAVFTVLINFVKTNLGNAFKWFRDSIIKPVWDWISNFISKTWAAIKAIFTVLINFVKTNLGNAFKWLRDSVIRPVFDWIKNFISKTWQGIKGIFTLLINFVRGTLANAFTWLRDRVIKPVMDGIKAVIDRVWTNGIKPVFQTLITFLKNSLTKAFEKARDSIEKIWNGLRNIAAAPINFIINTVYNKGLRKALNKVRGIVGGDPLPEVAGIPKFAKGGKHKGGWAMVGEEGPELVNFSNPGRVYTAGDTKEMLSVAEGASDDQLRAMVGKKPSESLLPAGGKIGDAAKKAVQWLRGGLAKAAGFILNPLKDKVKSHMPDNAWGDIGRRSADSVVAKALSWIRGKDAEAEANGTSEVGGSGAVYNGAMGAFHRPSKGPITSPYGPRWGSFHAGTDIAGGGPTYAALSGIVQKVGWNILSGRSGIGILLNHAKDFWTYYGHNPVGGPRVRPGQKVKGGQHIGYQGATGNVTGTHLHFETHKGRVGGITNPATYLRDRGGMLPEGLSQVMNKTGSWEWVFTKKEVGTLANMADGLMTAQAMFDGSNLIQPPARNQLAQVGAGASGAKQYIHDQSHTVNVEKLEVNNPAPEPVSDSLPVALRKAGAGGPFDPFGGSNR